MYDLGYFRNNLDAIAARLGDRGFVLDVESFRKLDVERRAALSESEAIKAQRNVETQEIGKLKKAGEDTTERQAKVRQLGDRIAELDAQANTFDESFRQMMAGIPNLPHESVPTGKSSDDKIGRAHV